MRSGALVCGDAAVAETSLAPFWRYLGGKRRTAKRYPAPRYDTIIEPFAGSAGYSLCYASRRIILVERYAVIAEIWRYLIKVKASEIHRLPLVDSVDDLPTRTPQAARDLIGFCLNAATTTPCRNLSAGFRRQRIEHPSWSAGWDELHRARVAAQVEQIRHWTIIEGDYTVAPTILATIFVDGPYNNPAGQRYHERPRGTQAERDAWYAELGDWCRRRRGQVIVCENAGATWLPFERFETLKPGLNKREGSREVIWTNERTR